MTEQEIFIRAMECQSLEERTHFLDEACSGDAELRERVEKLIRQSGQLGSFLEHPPVEAISSPEVESPSEVHVAATIEHDDAPAADESDETFGAETMISDTHDEGEIPLGYLQPSDKPDSLGRLGHYEVLEVVGRGAFGTVLRAFDEKLQRVVAIKVLSPEMASTSPARKRFLREARSSAAVRHENVVAIYAVEDEPIPYLVMEYIPGKTLQQRLKEQGPLDFADVLRLGKQIADGLAAAHAEGLIHRDIKPGNILLEGGMNDRVKITDFGLARTADDASMTQSGVIAGTPLYMAPEQAQGQKLDQRADLFSLGSVLYQMLSGRPPFRAPNTVAVLKRVVDDEPRPIQEIIPEVPDWLCNLIGHLHAKDREDRYSTAQEVSALLQQSIDDLNAGRQPSIPAPNEVQDGSQSTSNASRSKKQQPRKAKAKDPNQPKKSVAAWAPILAVLVGAAAFFLAPRISRWMQTTIPDLPETALQAGLKFDGRDDWVQISGLDWQYPQFTIEAFVTSAPNSDNGTIAFLSSSDQNAKEWMSLFDGGPAEPGKRISGAAAKGKTLYENAYGPFAPGKRQHRALVFDGYKLHYYINGVWQGERQAEPREGLEWNMRELNIGCNGQQRQFFQGIIDQLQISRVARYEDNFTAPTQLESDERTLAFYKFDEGQGDVLKDASGNGHDGKIVGATWVNTIQEVAAAIAPGATAAPAPAVAPFDAEQARSHQNAWADYLGVPVEKDIVLGQDKDGKDVTLTMVLIPPGEFFMGATDAEKTKWFKEGKAENPQADMTTLHMEGPRHFVRITKPFWLSKHEMTKGQFRQFVDATSYQTEAETSGKGATRPTKGGAERKPELNWSNWNEFNREPDPVVNVSWNDAAKCCEWLTAQHPGMAFSLPTEAQWEFACRAGTKSSSYDCETVDKLRAYAQFGEEVFFLKRGGQLKPNAFGLYDMLGNVSEWCADWIGGYDKSETDDPAGPATPSEKFPYRAIRGGSFLQPMWKVRSTRREFLNPSFNFFDRGFRVAAAIVDEDVTIQRSTSDQWIDVIPLIDPEADRWDVPGPTGKKLTGRNEWKIENGELLAGFADDQPSKLVIPIDADWTAYEFEIEVTRKTGDAGLAINIPTSHRDCPLAFDYPTRAGLLLGNHRYAQTLAHGFSFENGVKSHLRFVVERGELDHVTVWDGGDKPIVAWNGDLDSLALNKDEGFDSTRRSSLFISGGSEFVFHRIRVRMLDDTTASPLRQIPSEQKPSTEEPEQQLAAGEAVDLIARLDPARDFRDDRLKVQDGKLITPKYRKDLHPVGSVGLIPYTQVPENYDVKLQLERVSEQFAGFNMGLIVDGNHVAVGMDSGFNTKVWGLDFLDGLPAHRPENETCNPGRRLEIGKNTDVTIEVRKNHIRAICNGETLIDWTGDPNRLSVFDGFKITKSDGLFFVSQADFIVHKIELIPYEASSPQTHFDWSDVWPADAPAPAIAPFDADQAKAHQEAWAKYLGVPVEYENSIGMKFRLIPPGEFMMGSTPEEIAAALKVAREGDAWRERINSEGPQHKVVLTQPIYVGTTEVTQMQYEQLMGVNQSNFSTTGRGKELVANLETDSHPVENVSWNEAADFCTKLSEQEKLKPFYFRSGETVMPLDGTGYRLPTEAEWESACRAGTTTRFWSGDTDGDLISAGWFGSNSGGRTHATGELGANQFGLYDVLGNVLEWGQDNWDPAFYEKFGEGAAVDPYNPFLADSLRVVRGGVWSSPPTFSRSSRRHAHLPTHHATTIGFRVVLPVEAVQNLVKNPNSPLNAALVFDGQDDHVALPVTYDGSTPITVEAVVQINNWADNANGEIIDNTGEGGFTLSASQLGFYFAAKLGNKYEKVWAIADDEYLGQPVALAGVRDGNTLRLYVNRKLVDQKTFPGGYIASTTPISIGTNLGDQKLMNAQPRNWRGQIFAVRLSNSVRAAQDLISPAQTQFETDEHTLALYHFDEDQGDTVKDTSGNGHDGTIVGAKWGQVDRGREVLANSKESGMSDPFPTDRLVAEYIQKNDYRGLAVTENEFIQLQNPLPNEPFCIATLTFNDKPVPSTQILEKIKELDFLGEMQFWNSGLNAEELKIVCENPEIISLILIDCPLRSADFSPLANLRRGVKLSIGQDQVIDDWRFLESIPSVTRLEVSCEEFRPPRDPSVFKNLQRLDFRLPVKLEDSLIAELQSANPMLRISVPLDSGQRQLVGKDPILSVIKRAIERGWTFRGNYAEGEWRSDRDAHQSPLEIRVASMTPGNALSDLDAKYIDELSTGLAWWAFDIPGCSQVDAFFEKISGIHVSKMDLAGTDITDHGLASLRKLRRLTRLNIQQTPVTPQAVLDFCKLHPYCIVDSDYGVIGYANRKEMQQKLQEAASQKQEITAYQWPTDAPAPAIAPFDADQAKAHQEAWAKYLDVPVEYENSIGMKFRLIPPGEFMMGTARDELGPFLEHAKSTDDNWGFQIESESPRHRVIITEPFYIGKHEVTQAQWEELSMENRSEFEGSDLPVEKVGYKDAQSYIAKLNDERSDERLTYILPTEAQWELACRAGSEDFWSFGDEESQLASHGYFTLNSNEQTHPVGKLTPNRFGIHDMHGNVWEWCSDYWASGDYYSVSPLVDPTGPVKTGDPVRRGGGWREEALNCRSARRLSTPGHHHDDLGFRVAAKIRPAD